MDPRGASRFGGIPVSRPRTYANKIVAVRIGAPVFNGTDSSISRGSGYPAPPHESDIADFFRRAATADSKVLPLTFRIRVRVAVPALSAGFFFERL